MKFLQKYSLTGLVMAVFVFIMPYSMGSKLFYGTINSRVFLVLGLAYALAAITIYSIHRTNSLELVKKERPLLGALFASGLVLVLAALFGVNPAFSFWSDILRGSGLIFVLHCGLIIVLLSRLMQKNDWVLMQRSFAISTTLFSAVYFFGKDGLELTGKFLNINLQFSGLTLGNTTFAAAYILFGIVFALVQIRQQKRYSRYWWLWMVAVAVQITSPLFLNINVFLGNVGFGQILENPGRFLGIARSSSVVAWGMLGYLGIRSIIGRIAGKLTWSRTRAKNWFAGICGFLVLSGLVMLFIPNTPVQKAYIKEATAARIVVWGEAWQGVQERPLLGWGPENFKYVFEQNFDNRLYRDEYLGEIWFDRAHNTILDTLVATGILGTLALLAVLTLAIRSFVRAGKNRQISATAAHLLGLLLVANFIQLQTAFDTVLTYFATALVLAYALWLERDRAHKAKDSIQVMRSPAVTGSAMLALSVIVILGSIFFIGQEFSRQKALYKVFIEPNQAERLDYVNQSLQRLSNFEGFRLASSSFIQGSVDALGSSGDQAALLAEVLRTEAKVYERQFNKYIEANPGQYRPRMNLAQVYYLQTILGDDHIEEARALVEGAYELSPNNQITYVMDSLSYLYSGDLDRADEILAKGLALDPENDFVLGVQEFYAVQRKNFPSITFLNLENL